MSEASTGSMRLPGLSPRAIAALLDELDVEVAGHQGPLEPRLAGMWAARAHARFAAGKAPEETLDDCWMAARCLIVDPVWHLRAHPPERLLTRRMMPVELALIGGEPNLARRVAAALGLPVMAGVAKIADAQQREELGFISPGLMGRPLTRPADLVGLAAGVYAGALAAMARGFEDEARMALRLLGQARYDGELGPGHRAAMARYGGLCEALAELISPGERDLAGIVADQVERYSSNLSAALDPNHNAAAPRRAMDTGSLAIVALAGLMGRPLDGQAFPPNPEVTPLATHYRAFVVQMAQGATRSSHDDDDNVENKEES